MLHFSEQQAASSANLCISRYRKTSKFNRSGSRRPCFIVNMKRLAILLATACVLSSCGILGGTTWDTEQLSSAASKALTATSLSDEQIVELCKESVAYMDQQNTIENGAYTTRLKKITKNFKVDGLTLNFKVYKTDQVNAFACGDGSVRVYTGLMDVMTDEEIVAVLGHEIGHVVNKDSKNAMKKAYMASAAQDLIGSAGTIGALTKATVGSIAESYLNAQYSQKREYAADDYGFQFAINQGYSKYSMYNALNRLASLSSGTSTSTLAQKFSDHPDSVARAERQKAKADKYSK